MNGNPFSFEGKVVAIVGATRGIGAAAARLFAAGGARVVVGSRKAEACDAMASDLVAQGHDALPCPVHIGRDEDCARFVAAAMEAFGRIDVIVANAGVNPVFAPLHELDRAAWDKVIETNLTGPWRLASHALPRIAEGGGGSMVMVSSINAFSGVPGAAAYGISKAGLNQMARQLASEWGARQVRVNAVAPGSTRTDMIRALTERPGWEASVIARTPLRRLGEPEDIAGAIAFMASDAARHVTGQVLTVDGGETIQRA